jgi:N-formylglutamate deformylase
VHPFKVIQPTAPEIPIVLSVPHCGVAFPGEIVEEYKSGLIQAPDDTDWFVNRLYDFGPVMGMTMIHAIYSRWVVDLNRDLESKPLYSDGRIITSLCPTTTFLGEPLYLDNRESVSEVEVNRRVEMYYHPYHQKLQELLDEKIEKFGVVLLWDCHSIRRHVSTIHEEDFPDFVLGDVDGTSASPGLIETAVRSLEIDSYSFQHNYPFKGGFITRYFGRPGGNQHALQLEMTKVNYMKDDETRYDQERAENIRKVLIKTFESLQAVLQV